jgi:hypothetical protein
MKFDPRTEEQCRAPRRVLPKGDYPFEIIAAYDKVSKAGHPMIEMRVRLYEGEKVAAQVFDYLLPGENMAYKLRHCCAACGLLAQYETGDLAPDMLVGRGGKAKVNIQKDKDGEREDKNVITDYIVPEGYEHKQKATASATVANTPGLGDTPPQDDLPF